MSVPQGYKQTRAGVIPEDWEVATIGELCSCFSGGTPSTSNPDYYGGDIPWITSGDLNKGRIWKVEGRITEKGLSSSSAKMVNAGTLLLALYGATAGVCAITEIRAAINQAILAILPKRIPRGYLFQSLQLQKEAYLKTHTQGGQPNFSGEIVKSFLIPFPPTESEQIEIARILTAWDEAIAGTSALIAAKVRFKRALMQELLTGARRFAEFKQSDDTQKTKYGLRPADWKNLRIGDFAFEVSQRAGDAEPLPVLSCTKHAGLVSSLKYFGKQIYSESLAVYKVVRRNQFAYATNHIEEGSIGLLTDIEAGVVSPMYTVFALSEKALPSFLFALFKTEMYRQIFAANTSASVDRRGSLRWKQFALIPVALPTLEEQRRIAGVLDAANAEVANLQGQLAALKAQKRGLMGKLLSGEVRVGGEVSETAPLA